MDCYEEYTWKQEGLSTVAAWHTVTKISYYRLVRGKGWCNRDNRL